MAILNEQVLITLIQSTAGVALAWIAYKQILANQQKMHAKIDENTEKTEQIGIAVNGRVEELAAEKAKDLAKELAKELADPLRAEIETMRRIIADMKAEMGRGK